MGLEDGRGLGDWDAAPASQTPPGPHSCAAQETDLGVFKNDLFL